MQKAGHIYMLQSMEKNFHQKKSMEKNNTGMHAERMWEKGAASSNTWWEPMEEKYYKDMTALQYH